MDDETRDEVIKAMFDKIKNNKNTVDAEHFYKYLKNSGFDFSEEYVKKSFI
jgi:hypothetical protein